MQIDLAMPTVLFLVTIMSLFLEKKVEGKLKSTLEEREFKIRDAVMFVVAISVTVSIVVFVPQMAIMAIFLFAYSMLLFTFTYLFSDLRKTGIKMFSASFLVISPVAAISSLFVFGEDAIGTYSLIAFSGLFVFALSASIYAMRKIQQKEKWYLAVLPPALFLMLYAFFSRTAIWFPYLLDIYGVIFAVLIILYIGTLFTWKTTLVFAGLLTVMDIILVLFTGTMVSAARQVQVLRLPMLVSVPTVPLAMTENGLLYMSLGLGDFFFAGLISIQTLKKYGRKMAIASAITMTVSFFAFETYLLNYEVTAFPGTLMIICGWLPIILGKIISERTNPNTQR